MYFFFGPKKVGGLENDRAALTGVHKAEFHTICINISQNRILEANFIHSAFSSSLSLKKKKRKFVFMLSFNIHFVNLLKFRVALFI